MNDNIRILINKLTAKTIADETIWVKTSRENEFKLNLSKGAITIDEWEDSHGNNVDFVVLNENGDQIENISFLEDENLEEFKFLKDLHDLIKNKYFKIDQTFGSIMDELDSSKIIGEKKKT